MAVPSSSGFGFSDFFKDAVNVYGSTMEAKTASENAKAEAAKKSAIEAQINAKTTSDAGISTKNMLLIAGGGVILIGAIIALK